MRPVRTHPAYVSIVDVTERRRIRSIAKAVLTLANELDLNCIAEGIEDKEQLELLRGLGCRRMQGLLLLTPPVAGVRSTGGWSAEGRPTPKGRS